MSESESGKLVAQLESLDKARQDAAVARAKLADLLEEMSTAYGCDDVEEAEAMLVNLKKDGQRMAANLEEAIRVFTTAAAEEAGLREEEINTILDEIEEVVRGE